MKEEKAIQYATAGTGSTVIKYQFDVTSSGPTSSAANVDKVADSNQKTTPITVDSVKTSSTKEINK